MEYITIIQDPIIQTAVAVLFLYILTVADAELKRRGKQIPFLGTVITIYRLMVEEKKSKLKTSHRIEAEVVANNIVQNYEVLKKEGKIDSATAHFLATKDISRLTGLKYKDSEDVVRSAVFTMNRALRQ